MPEIMHGSTLRVFLHQQTFTVLVRHNPQPRHILHILYIGKLIHSAYVPISLIYYMMKTFNLFKVTSERASKVIIQCTFQAGKKTDDVSRLHDLRLYIKNRIELWQARHKNSKIVLEDILNSTERYLLLTSGLILCLSLMEEITSLELLAKAL